MGVPKRWGWGDEFSDAVAKSSGDGGDHSFSTRRIVESSCKTEEVEPGKFIKKCDKTEKVFRDCVGRMDPVAMAMTQSMRNIEPLNGSNFSTWKLNVEIMLAFMDLDYVLTQERPALTENMTVAQIRDLGSAVKKWDKHDRLTKMIITSTISEALRGGLSDTSTARELWAVLKQQFVGSEMSRQFAYLQKLMKLSFDGTGSVREHLLYLSRLVIGIREAGMEFNDQLMVHIGVISLPDSYETFKVNYIAQREPWDLNQLINLCVAEEDRLKTGKKESANLIEKKYFQKSLKPRPASFKPKWREQKHDQAKVKTGQQKQSQSKTHNAFSCFHCGKPGHMIAECRSKQAGKPRNKKGVEEEKKAKAKRAAVPSE